MWPDDEEQDPYVMGALTNWLGLPAGNTNARGQTTPLTLSMQTNGLQDVFQMLGDPNTAAIMAALTGAPTFDYAQQPVDDTPAPVVYTPTLDRLMNSDDQDSQWLAQQVQSGMDSVSLAKQIRANAALDDETKKDYISIAQAAIKEMDDSNKAQAEYQSRPVPLSENEKLLRKQGLPMPWEEYTADNVPVPDGFDTNGRGDFEAQRMRSTRRAMDAETFLRQNPAPATPSPAARVLSGHGTGVAVGPGVFEASGGQFGWRPTGDAPAAPAIQGLTGRAAVNPIEQAIRMAAGGGKRLNPNDGLVKAFRPVVQNSNKSGAKRRAAEKTVQVEKRTADWINRQEAGNQAAAYAIEAYKKKQAGQTPFRDAVAQRAALLRAAGINV